MAKYLLLWEMDNTRTPIDAKERGGGYQLLLDMVRQDLEKGIVKDWGVYVGENRGYTVVEGTEVEIGKMLNQYVPFVIFKETRAISSLSQVDEIVRALLA